MARVIQEHIKKPLAEEVLFGRLKSGGHVRAIVIIEESGETKLGFDYPDGPVTPRADKLPEPRRAKKRRSTPRCKPYGPRGDDTPPRRRFAERFDISLNWLICGEGYGLSPRLARNHGGKCNPPGNGTDQSQSTAISLKMARGRQSLAARLPVRE